MERPLITASVAKKVNLKISLKALSMKLYHTNFRRWTVLENILYIHISPHPRRHWT